MKIVFISDTHTKHHQIEVPEGDLLIHAGDFSSRGYVPEVEDFFNWYRDQPHPHKVVIAGNHDFLAEKNPEKFRSLVPENVIYLEDSGTTIEGIHIWGSPITPWFYNWAFNRYRGDKIRPHWDLIPDNTDIIITHGPPFGILDKTARGEAVGCRELLAKTEKVKPRIHVFGHIHEAYGEQKQHGTHFINASTLNLQYKVAHQPVIVDW